MEEPSRRKRGLRIGIVWSGDALQDNVGSSIGLAEFLKLLNADATFVSAQHEIAGSDADLLRERPEVQTFGDALNGFSEAAALVSRLDLLITVDSSMAHLAGALGKPVWVLLRHTPDWRSTARTVPGTQRPACSGKTQTAIGTRSWSGSRRSYKNLLKRTVRARRWLPSP
jgi:ADP-heptose:LPS heptosyltransferase